ncbi:MAG TPA: BON domain-containing protein [Flavisolibacter sp.]|nr:BON domain-containing protein [Flavisolibacter sp.]
MRKITYLLLILSMAGVMATSCKNKKNDTTTTTQTTPVDTSINTTAPVQVSPDDALTKGLQDATKDYPGVSATVNNGEVTLTGTIKKDRLPKLMQSIHALNPKKVNNNLTIQ